MKLPVKKLGDWGSTGVINTFPCTKSCNTVPYPTDHADTRLAEELARGEVVKGSHLAWLTHSCKHRRNSESLREEKTKCLSQLQY